MTDEGPLLDSIWLTDRRPSTSRQPGLTREQIVEAAVAVLDADGMQALSMRKLAARLDVAPMSLYWHVPTKDALLELALDAVSGEIALPPDDDHWADRLRAIAGGLREAVRAHPWTAMVYGVMLNAGPEAMRVYDAFVGALEDSPLPREEIAPAAGVLNNYIYGFIVNEMKWSQRVAAHGRTLNEVNADVTARFTEAYGDRFPRISRYLGLTDGVNPDELFEYGLARILRGIAAEDPG
ncbi:TetR/AcrR family transcriptional regulator [Amycolatopsis sp. 195334CR]|uniref:TetR/AcrR family transcriptional regulator n=1 Tax=Amycolatopsis sp. 195334CR TaxID=2814588 RepID=UPI001A904AB6|nr:TetR/AcrR family transcriptional regulator C-terminal domain-containing protein [Amycolatopsis sp. 195334CR]MBN6034458.1 TetR/AcrR family transcriptional regulator C-terminal domain-containing protein [Amycolatopsis sp. 195334CR]